MTTKTEQPPHADRNGKPSWVPIPRCLHGAAWFACRTCESVRRVDAAAVARLTRKA